MVGRLCHYFHPLSTQLEFIGTVTLVQKTEEGINQVNVPPTSKSGRGGYHVARNGPKPPASIAELSEIVILNLWDDSQDVKHYLTMAEKYRKEGQECARRGDLEGAYIELARAATLMLEKLPVHRDYNGMLNANQRNNLSLVRISTVILPFPLLTVCFDHSFFLPSN